MSTWKPGTRVVKVAANPVRSLENRHMERHLPIGTTSTVIADPPRPGDLEDGCDFTHRPDGLSEYRFAGWSHCWRPIDTNDSTGITSLEALKRTLTTPARVGESA